MPPGHAAAARHAAAENKDDRIPWVCLLAFVFLTYNTATAAYRSKNDLTDLSFVLVTYFGLVGLFWCLREFERSDPKNRERRLREFDRSDQNYWERRLREFEGSDQKNRERLKVAVWILATLLTTGFFYRAAAFMPLPVAGVIWCLAFACFSSKYPQLQRLLSLGSNMEPNEGPPPLQDDLESQLVAAIPVAAMESSSDAEV